MHKKIEQIIEQDTKNGFNNYKCLIRYRQLCKENMNSALFYIKGICKKLSTNQIIEFYSNDDIEELILKNYKNLPEFLSDLK